MDGNFRVGLWRVEPSLNTVSRSGTIVHLEPKVMQVLVCLAQHPGEPVSKETVLQAVWRGTFVSDDVLKRSIHELRRVFEDDAREPRFIQTIAKRGYRLVAPLEPLNGTGTGTALVTRRPLHAKSFAPAAAAALALLVIFSESGLRNWRVKATMAESSPAHVEPRIQNAPPQRTKSRSARVVPKLVKKRAARIVPADPERKKPAQIPAFVANGPTLSPSEAAGTSHGSLESGPARVETLFQNISPDVVRTRVTHAVLPAYPAFATQAHVTGTVEIGLAVSRNGDVASARVLIGHPMLITAALEAIRQWRFQPNRVWGEVTCSRMRALVRFGADGTTSVAFAPPLLADSFGDPGAQRDERRDASIPPIVPEDR